jgi:hypothetical protein
VDAEKQLATFMAAYTPEIAKRARAIRAVMRKRLPGAMELVYDNYNALVIAYGASERVSDVICSFALYPRWINLFFMHGAKLPDPKKRLLGSGPQIRRVLLEDAKTLDDPAIRALLKAAVARAKTPLGPKQKGQLVIKSVSKKQRPRRP